MKIEFTSADVSHTNEEIGRGLVNFIPTICQMVIREYEKRDDDRTLVIILTDQYFPRDKRLLNIKNAVLVSPFEGIDTGSYCIYKVDKRPPVWQNYWQLYDLSDLIDLEDQRWEFMKSFKKTIDHALA